MNVTMKNHVFHVRGRYLVELTSKIRTVIFFFSLVFSSGLFCVLIGKKKTKQINEKNIATNYADA